FNIGTNGSVTSISAVHGTVNYTGNTNPITFDLEGNASTGITGGWTGITVLVGSGTGTNDTVTGTNDTYNLTGSNAGNNGIGSWTNVGSLADPAPRSSNLLTSATDGSAASITAFRGTVNYTGYTGLITFNLEGGTTTGITGGWTGITVL